MTSANIIILRRATLSFFSSFSSVVAAMPCANVMAGQQKSAKGCSGVCGVDEASGGHGEGLGPVLPHPAHTQHRGGTCRGAIRCIASVIWHAMDGWATT